MIVISQVPRFKLTKFGIKLSNISQTNRTEELLQILQISDFVEDKKKLKNNLKHVEIQISTNETNSYTKRTGNIVI